MSAIVMLGATNDNRYELVNKVRAYRVTRGVSDTKDSYWERTGLGGGGDDDDDDDDGSAIVVLVIVMVMMMMMMMMNFHS